MALQEGLSETTVLDIFKKKAKEKQRGLERGLVRVLGVDEISVRKGHKNYALVLTDLERRCVLEVFDNRLQETFEQWLAGLSKQEKRAIKVVSMDMWKPYRYAVQRKLPKAKIVADRFHVVKQLNHQLNLLRRKLQRQANEQLAETLKGSRWILLKNRADLSPKEAKKLTLILAACPELRQVYLLSNYEKGFVKKEKSSILRKKSKKRRIQMLYAKVNETAREVLEQAIKIVQNAKKYRRLKVIDLSAKGQKASEIAAIFDLSDHTVRGYINRYNQGGLEGLKPNYGQGRNKTITLSKDELSELLERSPSQFEKLDTGARNWNQALMKQYLWEYHQIDVSQSAISRRFKHLGIPWNRAKKK